MRTSLMSGIFVLIQINYIQTQSEAVFDALSSLRQIVDSSPELKEAKNEYNRLVCNLTHPSGLDDGLRKGLMALLAGRKINKNTTMNAGLTNNLRSRTGICILEAKNDDDNEFRAFTNSTHFMSPSEFQRKNTQQPQIAFVKNPEITQSQKLIANIQPVYTRKPQYDTVQILSPPNNGFLCKQPAMNFLSNIECVQSAQVLCSLHSKDIQYGNKYTITVPKNTLESLKLLGSPAIDSNLKGNSCSNQVKKSNSVKKDQQSVIRPAKQPLIKNNAFLCAERPFTSLKSARNIKTMSVLQSQQNTSETIMQMPIITRIITTKTVFSSLRPITSTVQVTKTETTTHTQPPIVYYGKPQTSTITQTVNSPPKTVNRTFIPRNTPTAKINVVELKSVFKDLICNLPRPKPWILREKPNTVVLTQTIQQPAVTVTTTNLEPYFNRQQAELGKIFNQIAHLYALIKKGLGNKTQQTVVLKVEQSLQKNGEMLQSRTKCDERYRIGNRYINKTAEWCPAGIKVVCKTKTYVGNKDSTKKESLKTLCNTQLPKNDCNEKILMHPGSSYTKYSTRTIVGPCEKGQECEKCCSQNGHDLAVNVPSVKRCASSGCYSETQHFNSDSVTKTCENDERIPDKQCKILEMCGDANNCAVKGDLIINPQTDGPINYGCDTINASEKNETQKNVHCTSPGIDNNSKNKFSTIVETVINNATHKFFYPGSTYTVYKTHSQKSPETECSPSFSCITSTKYGTIFIECPEIQTCKVTSQNECYSQKTIPCELSSGCDWPEKCIVCMSDSLSLEKNINECKNGSVEHHSTEKSKSESNENTNSSHFTNSHEIKTDDTFCETSIQDDNTIINCTSIPRLSKEFLDEFSTQIAESVNDDIKRIFSEVLSENLGSSILRIKLNDSDLSNDFSSCFSKTQYASHHSKDARSDISETMSQERKSGPWQELSLKLSDPCVDDSYASECIYNYTASLPKDEIYIQQENSSLLNEETHRSKLFNKSVIADSYVSSTKNGNSSVKSEENTGDRSRDNAESNIFKNSLKTSFTKLSDDFANKNYSSVSTFGFSSRKGLEDNYCTDSGCVDFTAKISADHAQSKNINQETNENSTKTTSCDGKNCYEIEILTKTLSQKPYASSESKDSTRIVTLDEIDYDNGETIVKTITDSEFAYLFDDNDLEATTTYFIKNPIRYDASEKNASLGKLIKYGENQYQIVDRDFQKDKRMRISDLPIFHKKGCPLKQGQEFNAQPHECTYDPSHTQDEYIHIPTPKNDDSQKNTPDPHDDNLVSCGGAIADDPEILLMSEILGESK